MAEKSARGAVSPELDEGETCATRLPFRSATDLMALSFCVMSCSV